MAADGAARESGRMNPSRSEILLLDTLLLFGVVWVVVPAILAAVELWRWMQ